MHLYLPLLGLRNVDEDGVTLLVLVFAAAAYMSSRRWAAAVPKMFTPSIVQLEREIGKLQTETNALSDVSNFLQHSKNTRQLNKMRQDLDEKYRKQRARGWMANNAPYIFAWVIQLGMLLPLAALFSDLELVMIPEFATSVWIVPSTASFGRGPDGAPIAGSRMVALPFIGGTRSIGVVAWYLLVQVAAWFVMRVARFGVRS
jgi:uncharacterized membrane protein (DUF106 family)